MSFSIIYSGNSQVKKGDRHSFACFIAILVAFVLFPSIVAAQIGINQSNPNFSAVLDINSTSKGVLFPRLTIAQRDNIVTAANAQSVSVPAGLAIFCTNCCKNGKGSLYSYNGTDWKSMDTSCVDVNEAASCYSMVTTIVEDNHMSNSSSPALLIDGNTALASQPNSSLLRMHKTTDDLVTFDFPEDLPAGYKIRLYYNDNEDPGDLGLYVNVINNGNTIQTINTDTGTLPGSSITNVSGNDYYVDIVLSGSANELFVRSANDDSDHVVFLEIKVFDSNNVEIPLSCP